MTQADPSVPATGDVFETIVGFLLPFFLTAANGNPDRARAAIAELLGAYGASTATEHDLVGRIIGFSIVAMDNLRLSMTNGMSDTKALRYRCNAVTLGRASDRARTLLEASQAKRGSAGKIPRPTVARPTHPGPRGTGRNPNPSRGVRQPAGKATSPGRAA
jgi:hypothetical protein